MKLHYEIDHYPNLKTFLFTVSESDNRMLVTDRYTLLEAKEHCREGYQSRGLTVEFDEQWKDGVKLIKTQEITIDVDNNS